MPRERPTEPTFYPALMQVIRERGGKSVQEVSFNSVPDIKFQIANQQWLLSVKIGESLAIIKSATLQYFRHKRESGIPFGIILLLPESARQIRPVTEDTIRDAVQSMPVTALIDASLVKDEIREFAFPQVMDLVCTEVQRRLKEERASYYKLPTVVALLQHHVAEMMADITLDERSLLRIITDRDLLMDLGHLKRNQVEDVARFLAAYILLSQILFLRLLCSAQPGLIKQELSPVTHHKLRAAFAKVLEINYRPIYKVDVLDDIPKGFLEDTFDLIWGLEIERVRYEIPGRIFHELMPSEIRKMLAAFYTRPIAAEMLADITISRSDQTVLDPACGSGTILVSAYRRKRCLFEAEGKTGNPHKRFSEEEMFGADVMPFAVHLTSANLAAMDAATTIDLTQVIQGDSLELWSGKVYEGGIQQPGLFHEPPVAHDAEGELYRVRLDKVDVVLMNPPFTKVERGIRRFVDMERFRDVVGGEVGLWGHFIALAERFLRRDGVLGAVIPVNVLRGRESEKVRKMLFEQMTPICILKPTYNYGFSEWSEYRDILFIAQNKRPTPDHSVKFGIVKHDLTRMTHEEACSVTENISAYHQLRSEHLDIDSHSLSEIELHFDNLMWFCGGSDLSDRDILVEFVEKCRGRLLPIEREQTATGFRSDRDVSKFLFITRMLSEARTEQAFLRFSKESGDFVSAGTQLGASFQIPKSELTPSVRTQVGLPQMDLAGMTDYIAHAPYSELNRVVRAAGFRPTRKFNWERFWERTQADIRKKCTNTIVACRINPFSPNVYLTAYYSDIGVTPSDQFNLIKETNQRKARGLCVVLNSIVFFAQLFLLREESTGRYLHIRLYDLGEMFLNPTDEAVDSLVNLFDRFKGVRFPPLRKQFDWAFMQRYEEFWDRERHGEVKQDLWPVLDKPVEPATEREDFDMAVCDCLGIDISREELRDLYRILVQEMIITKGLRRD